LLLFLGDSGVHEQQWDAVPLARLGRPPTNACAKSHVRSRAPSPNSFCAPEQTGKIVAIIPAHTGLRHVFSPRLPQFGALKVGGAQVQEVLAESRNLARGASHPHPPPPPHPHPPPPPPHPPPHPTPPPPPFIPLYPRPALSAHWQPCESFCEQFRPEGDPQSRNAPAALSEVPFFSVRQRCCSGPARAAARHRRKTRRFTTLEEIAKKACTPEKAKVTLVRRAGATPAARDVGLGGNKLRQAWGARASDARG